MRYSVFILLLFLLPVAARSQQDTFAQRIVLIGDGGALTPDGHHTVVEAVEQLLKMDKRTTVLFLGDNLYRHGLPDEQYLFYKATKAVLDSQANIADHTPGMVYFIPGNHDWMNGAEGGYKAILREQRYLDGLGKKNLKFYPEDGCPGPVDVKIGKNVVLIMMDSQWWIHQNEKPGIESECKQKTREEVVEEIKDIVNQNLDKLVIFACHHPFRTNGAHGGYYTIKQHIFPFTDIRKNLYVPLPLLGSIYPISRSVFGTPQDLKHPDYSNMVSMVDEVLKLHPHVIHVAGHEHAMEWIADSNNHYIVSGSGCKTARVSKSRKSKFEASELGFATLDIYKDKTVRCSFYGASKDSIGLLYSDVVFNYGKLPKEAEAETGDTTMPAGYYKDTVVVAASNKYVNPRGFRKWLIGENYRKEWAQPVSLKVFHLRTDNGGYKITGAGGGFQTKSIHLEDTAGREYNLRTIDKDPRRVLPPGARSTFARDVVRDMISAAYPYTPIPVSEMADAAGIINAKPTFYYVPDDPALGFYRPVLANKVVMLEAREPVPAGIDTRNTTKVVNKLIGEHDHFADQASVLQARLLDMNIGDWDRHFDQWRFAVDDTGKGKLYYPIPRDRDQAFFRSDGALMWLASKRYLRWMSGFRDRQRRFVWLSHSARDFDRVFLNGLNEQQWREGIRTYQQAESDTVIAAAVRQMPPEIFAIRGEEIIHRLKSRRDLLTKQGMQYYRFLSREVNVLGSNKNEYFLVKSIGGKVGVQVHAREKDASLLIYSRVFDPKVTKEIRLYGFNGNDMFYVAPDVRSRIKIRIIGGLGNDTFKVAGRARTEIYDLSTEDNPVLAARHTDVMKSADPRINEFSIQDYQYNETRFPRINLGANPEDGVLFGIGISNRAYGFRKDPYKRDQKLSSLYSFAWRAFQLKYSGNFINIHHGLDLEADAIVEVPALRNFFGYGNETKFAAGKDNTFYRARYKYASADVLLQRRLFNRGVLKLGIGPSVFHYWNNLERNDGLILESPSMVGLDSQSVFSRKTYLGGKAEVLVNNVNNELFPTRGIYWRTTFTALGNVSKETSPFTDIHSDMNIYASLSDPARLIAVLKAGGGHIFSDKFEYFQAESIGAGNYLRGFRKNRFSGRSMAYGSAELRLKLADIHSYIFPGTLGLVGFDDVARVWMDGEHSRKWHNAYGGGVYYIPYDLFIISGTIARSPEQILFNITVGTKLNLTF